MANTERMNEPRLCGRLLTTLFRCGRDNETIDIIGLAGRCGAELPAVRRAMTALERAGLADAGRLRLTLAGLALGAALSEPSERERVEQRPRRGLPRARHAA